jgi:acyl dehydratase
MAEVDRSLLGVWGAESTLRVETGKVREFARAVKDPNPLYLADDGPVAPPTFLMTIAHWIKDLGETRSAVKLDYRRLLHGEQEFEYLAPIRAGDVLTFRSRTKDVFEKQGKRGGTMTFIIGETEFRNQRGEVVAYMRNTAIETADAVKE